MMRAYVYSSYVPNMALTSSYCSLPLPAKRDGWNMYGDLNSDGTPCEANCRRYTDPTGGMVTTRTTTPCKKSKKEKSDRRTRSKKPGNCNGNDSKSAKNSAIEWRPLLEDNGSGLFSHQIHVTPHIGRIGKTALLTKEQFDARELDSPDFDYDVESRLVMERMASLSDTDKMLIEFMDNKFSVTFAVIGAVAMKGASFEQILNFVTGLTAVEYESIMLAWKEKVQHNLIRPTTWIQDNLGEERFETWAGPKAGVKEISGKNFEAFVRVMPHSEYVSGSACLCQGLHEFVDSWLTTNLGIADSISVNLTFDKFSSKTEPGFSPSTDINIEFKDMLSFRDACGESRLKGGMHFTKSIADAYELCEGIGYIGGDYAQDLWG